MINSFYNTNALQSLPGNVQQWASQLTGAKYTNTSTNAAANTANVADMFTLSPTANMVQQFLNMDISEAGGNQGEADLTSLGQMKQQSDMIANMLQMKIKGFESSLIASMKAEGLDPSGPLEMKNGQDGLTLLNDRPDGNALEKMFKKDESLQQAFQELARMAGVLEMLGQIEGSTGAATGLFGGENRGATSNASAAQQYARQSRPTSTDTSTSESNSPEARFVFRFLQGSSGYSF